MKVNIGPYRSWIGPFQIVDWFTYFPQKWGWMTDDTAHAWGKKLSKTPLNAICNWIHSKKHRKVEIHIDEYDAWNAHHTLSMIIHPVLVELRRQKHGSGHVDDEDVPENLRSTSATPLTEHEKDHGHVDELWHKRWEWVLDEMIYAFECDLDEDWDEQFWSGESDTYWEPEEGGKLWSMKHGPNHTRKWDQEAEEKARERLANGRRLFAKYYLGLWD